MSYEEAVASAAAALTRGEDANWELARLTHENTIKGGGRQTSDGLVSMARWCGDVRQVSGRKFSLRTGGLYKAVWEANSASLAELPSFSEALREASPTSYVQPERPQREPEGTGVPSEPERLVTTTPLTPLTLVPVDETDDMP